MQVWYLHGDFTKRLPLEYLCYAWCQSYGWTPDQFWQASTDTIFTWMEFAEVESATRRQVRFGPQYGAKKDSSE